MYFPEKFYARTEATTEVLQDIKKNNAFVTGIAISWDEEKRHVLLDLGNGFIGVLPENEISIEELKYTSKGSIPKQAKSLITKKVCAKITKIDGYIVYLSRKELQQEAMKTLKVGKSYQVVIKAITPHGVFVDIGMGIIAFIHISEILVTKLRNEKDIPLSVGQTIWAILLKIEDTKLCMSYRRCINKTSANIGDMVLGIIREETDDQTGYFVEISPNECGIVDKVYKGKKIYIEYGSVVRLKIKNYKILVDTDGSIKTQYKLRIAS